jgi:hypothetical protein
VGSDVNQALTDRLDCSSDVYMTYYAETLPPSRMLGPDETILDVFGHCTLRPAYIGAICSSFFNLALRSGTAAARDQLQMCGTIGDDPYACFNKFAVESTLSALSTTRGDWERVAPSTCLDGIVGVPGWERGAKAVEDACWFGATQGLLTQGLADTEMERMACDLMPVSRCDSAD